MPSPRGFVAFLAAFSAVSACGGAPPAVPPAPGAPDAGTASGSPAPAPADSGAAPAAEAAPTVKVTEVVGSAESTAYMKVTAVFTNPSSRPCKIASYTLIWSGGTKQIKLDDFSVPAGESRQRTVRVHPDDGDLKTLTMQSARVDAPKCAP